ncbi:hypothetical protein [Altererythrobacter aquiaggeris]|uniref:hypothetical protein n=1 Tax=Aestuarierythrobacter aquiaggeris TaxID=1898396 RepID=UPI0030181EE2
MNADPAKRGFSKAPGSRATSQNEARGSRPPGPVATRWAALNDAGNAVALMAGMPAERTTSEVRNFPAIMRDCESWRLKLVNDGLDDLASFMEPGLAALLAVSARGQDAAVPAQTLWREFQAARAGLLALLPENAALGPLRSA